MFKKFKYLMFSLLCASTILCSQESRRAYNELLKNDAQLQLLIENWTGTKTSKRERKKLYKKIIQQMEKLQLKNIDEAIALQFFGIPVSIRATSLY